MYCTVFVVREILFNFSEGLKDNFTDLAIFELYNYKIS